MSMTPPQPPYQGQLGGMYVPPPTNSLAILALVFGVVVPIAGIICGHIARRQIKQTGEGGDGLALAGLTIGYALTGFTILVIVFYFARLLIVFSALPR